MDAVCSGGACNVCTVVNEQARLAIPCQLDGARRQFVESARRERFFTKLNKRDARAHCGANLREQARERFFSRRGFAARDQVADGFVQ